jgi:magnesium transporter
MILVRSLRNERIEHSEGIESMRTALASPEPDWLQVIEPTQDDLDALRTQLDLHPLALRDAVTESQPPKLEDFGPYLFFIVHVAVKEAYGQTRRISVFLATNWIVTIQSTASKKMDEVAERVEQAPEHLLRSPDALAHVVIDHMTGGFEGLTADILEEMIQLEDRVLLDASPASMEAILKMRRRVIGLARVMRSQRDVCASMCRTSHAALSQEIMPFMRDVYDHILRVFELLETGREGLAVTRDAYLAVVNNRLSEIMRTLTIIATVMMPLSLLAGIYGMNFSELPLMDHPLGFWLTIGGMVAIAGGMLLFFRSRRWF